ncbi:MAG: biotin-dependent carboxyltransferase family protein [Peptoniphilaceae bacterium]
MAKIIINNGGILTTVQDYGRIGYQKFGITPAGVMDEYSYELANALVGNERGEAVLEITYFGPIITFEEDIVIALTGGEVDAKVDGQIINMNESILIKAGSQLSVGKIKNGVRTYLAFGGVIDVEKVNNSKSTLIKSSIGGFKGRALKAKDEINILVNKNAKEGNKLEEKYIPKISKFNVLRVVLGPQDDYFTEKGIHDFFRSGGYTVSKNADRMGIRLEGKSLETKNGSDIISDSTVKGSIQVPTDGKPIVLLADRQTTGGYTKIGTLIKEDISKLAQMSPGNKLCFQKIDLDETLELYNSYEEKILKIRKSLGL